MNLHTHYDEVAYLSLQRISDLLTFRISVLPVGHWEEAGTSILLDFQFTALLEMGKDNCICSGSNMAVLLSLLFSCLEIKFPSIMSILGVDLLPSNTFL